MKKYTLNSYVVLAIILSFISFAQGWVAWYNGPGDSTDVANAIALDNSANVYVTGESVGSDTDYDYATIKYNASGDSQWVARYNGPGNDWDGARAIAVDNAGNVYVTGGSDGAGTYYDYATVKYDSSGVERWVTRYNGPGNWSDKAHAIAVDNAGNIYVTGESDSSGSYHDYATVKYDSSGVAQWVVRFNGPGNDYDRANAIAIDNWGNIYVTGLSYGSGTNDDYATVKYDSYGVEQWVIISNGLGNDYDEANAIALDDSANIYVTGKSMGLDTDFDYMTIKYSSTGVKEDVVTRVKNSYLDATIFRGPLLLPEGKKCKVFDIAGRVVEPTKITRGIYFIVVDGKITRKAIKIR